MGKVLHIDIVVLAPVPSEGEHIYTETKVYLLKSGETQKDITDDTDIEETDRYEEEVED